MLKITHDVKEETEIIINSEWPEHVKTTGDAAWYLLRLAVDEGENRYGLLIWGTVYTSKANTSVITCLCENHTFSYVLGDMMFLAVSPTSHLESQIYPAIRTFAEMRNEGSDT